MKIVAPAGDIERFYAAIKSGADEIYMGLKGFGARRNAENFTVEEIKEAIDYAHERGSRVFLTLNTLMKNVEIEFLYTNFKKLYEHGLDAVIIQDLGYFRFLKENFPNIDYHGSTQMTVANHVEANYLKKIGFKRIVLPREMSFEEIKKIKEKTDIELEVFVSGALCVSYSGNCYMSSFIGGRSGNRGMCAQPCRKEYTTSTRKGYLLSPKDQLMKLEEINKLKEIGIDSIKIEGRMKQSNYIYEAVTYFKGLLKGEENKNNIDTIFNRGYSKGYLGNSSSLINEQYSFNVGKRIGIASGKEVKLEENIMLGDGITYYSKDFENLGGDYINRIEKKSKKEKFKEASPGDKIILLKIPSGTKYIFKNYDKKINSEIESNLKNSNKYLEIEAKFIGKLNEKPSIEVSCFNNFGEKISAKFSGEKPLEKASKKAATVEEVSKKLKETGGTSFQIGKCNITIDKEIFLPVSLLKQLRREVLSMLTSKLVESYRRKLDDTVKKFEIEISQDVPKHSQISAVVCNDEQERLLKELGIKKIYKKGYQVAKEVNLNFIDLNSNLASNLYQVLKNKSEEITVNWNLNITNIYSIMELSKLNNVKTVVLSPELSFEELENIGKVPVRKAMLGYSKLLGMYIERGLFENNEIIESPQRDKFISRINELGNTEIYFSKSLNVLSQVKRLGKIGIDEVIIELLDETPEEIKYIINNINRKENLYSPYNYERGVL
ncbi:U32 family peptidase [Fusobacterium sp. IOR10]|uniref:peptidase U32 family protein n=1 Tax=Fusobacterium sp. IOR10 TaxID=2665157 RepID=UPI0013D22A6D|nr:U32 family peptidase [Fusobacterium sp. IOR10]